MKFATFFTYLTACLSFSTAFAQSQDRIVSIGGDVTEIVYALNQQERLVGRDTTSILPKGVEKLPDVGYMRQLNTEGILALKPTQVIASSVAQPSTVFEQLKAVGVKVDIIPFESNAVNTLDKIKKVGEVLKAEKQAATLSENFTNQLKAIPNSPLDVKVMYIMNRAGANQMVAGSETVADTVFKQIGVKNAAEGTVRFAPISQEGLIKANPDLLVVTELSVKNIGSFDKLWELPGIALTNAGKNKQVVVVNDIALMSFGLTTPTEMKKVREAAEKVVAK